MNGRLPRTSLQPARSASDLFEEFDRFRDQLLGSLSRPEAGVGGWTPALPDLEEQVDEDGIEASLDRGVLRIRLPKTEETGRRKIEIS